MNSKFIIFLSCCIFLVSCLTGEKTVNGGPEDSTPPKLKKIEQKNNKVILTFNENIQLTDKNSIVTNLREKPEYKINQNKLIISELPTNNLKQLIYFKDGIKDLNNNNVLNNYIYAANVGADTFSIQGKVESATKKIDKFQNCYIVLVPENTKIEQINNLYNFNFNKTNEDGTFNIDFIPNPIGMSLFAYIDNNNNTLADTGDYAGFVANTIDSTLNTSIRLSYIGTNKIYEESLPSGINKTVYNNIDLAFLTKEINEATKQQIVKDSLFEYNNYSDSLILTSNILAYNNPIRILSNYNKNLEFTYSNILNKENTISLKNNISQDTFSYILSGLDTLRLLQLTKNLPESELIFKGTINPNTIIYIRDLENNIIYYDSLTTNNSFKLKPGKYSFFIFQDTNKNKKYDPYLLKDGSKRDLVLKILQDIDIKPKIDVEIGL